MKCLCDREQLLMAFGAVGGVVPARSPKPILQNVKLVVREDGATLMASDLEAAIVLRCLGIKIDVPGAAVLPFDKMGQILRSCTGDPELAIELDGNTLRVRGLRSKFDLPSEDADLYPEPPMDADGPAFTVNAGELRRAIKRTAFCVDPTSTRYALSGVLFEVNGEGEMAVVATDGRRLARQLVYVNPLPWEGEGDVAPAPPSPVVPAKALRLIEKNLPGDEGEDVTIRVATTGGGSILVRAGRATIWSRLVEGRFPNYSAVIPARHESRVEFPEVGPLLNAVEQARVTTSKESRGIDFTFDPAGVLKLGSQAADVGQSNVELPLDGFDSSEALALTLDGAYASEMLRAVDLDNPISVELIDPKSPVVFKTSDEYLAVIMPLSRG